MGNYCGGLGLQMADHLIWKLPIDETLGNNTLNPVFDLESITKHHITMQGVFLSITSFAENIGLKNEPSYQLISAEVYCLQ